MNLIKIAILLKKSFTEFYDIKLYRKQAEKQFSVKQYTLTHKKIIVDEEK